MEGGRADKSPKGGGKAREAVSQNRNDIRHRPEKKRRIPLQSESAVTADAGPASDVKIIRYRGSGRAKSSIEVKVTTRCGTALRFMV